MKTRVLFLFMAMVCPVVIGNAQEHSDIEFGYDDLMNPTAFDIEGDDFTTEGLLFFESAMEILDPDGDPGNYSADEPGFESAPDEGFVVNAGDRLWLNVINASVVSNLGQGYVTYFDPDDNSLSAFGGISIIDNTDSTADLVLDGQSIISGPNPQFIEQADAGGEIHDHVVFDLLNDGTAPFGAYGMLFELQADFASNGYGSIDLTSDRFWIIFNHGMDEDVFDSQALPAFGAIPEPGSLGLLAFGIGALALRRKRN